VESILSLTNSPKTVKSPDPGSQALLLLLLLEDTLAFFPSKAFITLIFTIVDVHGGGGGGGTQPIIQWREALSLPSKALSCIVDISVYNINIVKV
jgi:hypothetical protein